MIGILGGMGTQAGLDFCSKLAKLNRGKADQKYPVFLLYNKANIPDRKQNLKKYKNVLEKLKKSIKAYRKQKLSHGDLSEYNILNRREEPIIIDVGQAVPDSHPLYSQLHQRDIKNLNRIILSFFFDLV